MSKERIIRAIVISVFGLAFIAFIVSLLFGSNLAEPVLKLIVAMIAAVGIVKGVRYLIRKKDEGNA